MARSHPRCRSRRRAYPVQRCLRLCAARGIRARLGSSRAPSSARQSRNQSLDQTRLRFRSAAKRTALPENPRHDRPVTAQRSEAPLLYFSFSAFQFFSFYSSFLLFLIETRLCPRSLAPTLVVSPSMSLIPFAPFL